MAQIIPFDELGGLDLVSHDNIASPLRCRSCRNIQKRRSRSLGRRQGYKVSCDNDDGGGGYGTFIYNRRNKTTGVVTKEKLVVTGSLFKQTMHTLTIEYSGSGAAVCEILVDTTTETWHLFLYADGVEVLDLDLGVGYDETPIVDMDDVVTAINAVTDFSAVVSGGGSLPAAFLPYTAATEITSDDLVISFCETVEVNTPTGAADPFAGLHTNRAGAEFENASAVQINDIILFGSKWDEQKKYDGVDCYRSGAPQATIASVAEAGSGTFTNGTYKYIATIVQVDAQGNEVEGIESSEKSVTVSASHPVNVTLNNVLNTTGFNTDCAIVAGAQTGVTQITVDDGSGGNHTMKEGQTAYFYDGVSAGYVERTITAVDATSITISGANVNVADNAVISNNLRIRLFRTVASGTIHKENVDIPNNSFATTQVYSDNKADASLGADYVSPAVDGVEHGLPPKCGYLATYDGGIVAAGSITMPDSYYWTSPDGPEYYPTNYTDKSQNGDNLAITGLSAGERFLWLHKREASFLISGKLTTGQFTITKRGDSAGCLAHASIVQADTSTYWLGEGGVYESRDGGTPTVISDDIAPVFDNAGLSSERKLQFKRAVAVFDKHTKFYVLYIPAESEQGSEVYANQYSRVFAFDVVRREWWEWDNLNWAGGIVHDESTGDMIWTERRYSTFDSSMAYQMYMRLNTNTPADYVDHVSDITWNYEPAGLIDLGEPDINKKFLYIMFDVGDPEKTPNYTLICRIEKDNIRGIYQTQLSTAIGSGSSADDGWGFAAWGFFPWGNPVSAAPKPRRLKNGFSQSIRPIFSASGIYNEIVLSAFSLLVEAPFKVDINEALRV